MKTNLSPVSSANEIFIQYKGLADKAMKQLTDDEFFRSPGPESNSIPVIIRHLTGNMLSRWTDFITSDGEKSWRNRDAEFEEESWSREEYLNYWEKGWNCLFSSLGLLSDADLSKIVQIRNEPHSVLEAINRQIAHYAYHIGQIVYVAKMFKSNDWQTLTIAKNRSKEFNTKHGM